MADTNTLLNSLQRFAAILTGSYDIGDVLHNLTAEMPEVLDLAGAGVTLIHDGRQRFVTAPIEAIADVERVQEETQQGPCIDAVAAGRPVTVSDLAAPEAAERWPDVTEAARAEGLQAVAGIPMLANGVPVGALNLYDNRTRAWSAEDARIAAIFADIATGYLVHASATRQHQRTAEQLQQALNTRVVIEQAKGVLATSRGISVDDAFAVMRKYARDHNARIHDVAAGVVDGDLLR